METAVERVVETTVGIGRTEDSGGVVAEVADMGSEVVVEGYQTRTAQEKVSRVGLGGSTGAICPASKTA